MTKEMQIKIYKAIGLILSSMLIFSQLFVGGYLSTPFLDVAVIKCIVFALPIIYVGFVVPYFIWKILFSGKFADVKNFYLLLKIPTILVLNGWQIFWEFAILFNAFNHDFQIWTLLLGGICLLTMRIITYAMMIIVWQPNLYKNYSRLALTVITSYCAIGVVFFLVFCKISDFQDYGFNFIF